MNHTTSWLILGWALGTGLLSLLCRNKGLRAKKWFVIGVLISIDFLVLVLLISWQAKLQVFLHFALIFLVVNVICIKSIRVCEACGQDIYIKKPFDNNKYCISCNLGVKRGKQYHTED